MRSIRAGIVAGVALTLVVGATAAYGVWGTSVDGPQVTVRSGDLGVTTAWVNGTPAWISPFPGQSTDSTLRVTSTGSGTTLRWSLGASGTVATAFRPFATVRTWLGACGGTTPLTATPSGSFTPGAAVDVCVRVTLNSTAPPALRGQPVNPTVTVTATQRSS